MDKKNGNGMACPLNFSVSGGSGRGGSAKARGVAAGKNTLPNPNKSAQHGDFENFFFFFSLVFLKK
jgi:hypothetical protein